MVAQACLDWREGTTKARVQPVCEISQHAIERLFQRLGTMEVHRAKIELDSGLDWLPLLFNACNTIGTGRRIQQLAIPTRGGAFLCQRDTASSLLRIRTWVTLGKNERIDCTLASLHAWRVIATSGNHDATFRRLLGEPHNHWLLQPYPTL